MPGVVIDLGCHTHPAHPEDESVLALVEWFQPGRLYGFDPHPDLVEGMHVIGETSVHLFRKAMWTYEGEIAYDPHPERPLIASVGAGPMTVKCGDIADFVREGDIVKMDVEGAEYTLLQHLTRTGADEKIKLLLVEWHPPYTGRDRILRRLRCPIEEWAPQVAA